MFKITHALDTHPVITERDQISEPVLNKTAWVLITLWGAFYVASYMI